MTVTNVLIVVSLLVAARTRFGKIDDEFLARMYIQNFTRSNNWIEWDPSLLIICKKAPWRLLTPILLHFSPMHLFFNATALYSMGTAFEWQYGRIRFALFTLATAALSNAAQFWWHGPMFGGLSGVDYGLFGFIFTYSHWFPDRGWHMPRNQVTMFVIFTFACLLGLMGPIANAAHLVGFAAGAIFALLSAWWPRQWNGSRS